MVEASRGSHLTTLDFLVEWWWRPLDVRGVGELGLIRQVALTMAQPKLLYCPTGFPNLLPRVTIALVSVFDPHSQAGVNTPSELARITELVYVSLTVAYQFMCQSQQL